MNRIVPLPLVPLVILTLSLSTVLGDTLLFDDFNDGRHSDNDPGSWLPVFGPQRLTATSGDLHLVHNQCCAGLSWNRRIDGDVSIQTQGRVTEGTLGIGAKFGGGNGNDGYYFEVNSDGVLLFLSRVGGIEYDVETVSTGISIPRDEDIYLQLDVVGNQVFGWYWPQTAEFPEFPQLEFTLEDHPLIDAGRAGFYTGDGNLRLRYAHIGDVPIPFDNLPATHLFRDDFDTAETLDRWRGGGGQDELLEITRERLTINHRNQNNSAWVEDFDPNNVSLTTTFRVNNGPFTWATLFGRSGLEPNGTLYGGSNRDGLASLGMSIGSAVTILNQAATGLDPTSQDVSLQFDMYENRMRLWMWDADEPRPDQATIVANIPDVYPNQSGVTGFFYNPTGGSESVSLDFFDASDVQLLYADINFDNVYSAADADALCNAMRGGDNGLEFDINADGLVDSADLTEFLNAVGATPGDVDLDGVVDFGDFLTVSSQFEKPSGQRSWSSGDFDCSGRTEFADFLLLSANYGPSPTGVSTRSVPEPNGWSMTLFLLSLLPSIRRFLRSQSGSSTE